MFSDKYCQQHSKKKQYLCIDKFNQSLISFLCKKCSQSQMQTSGRKRILSLKNLVNKLENAQKSLEVQSFKLNLLEQNFLKFSGKSQDYKNLIILINKEHYNQFQVQQLLIQLQCNVDVQTYNKLLKNVIFQQLISEERIEDQNNIFQNVKQFTEQMQKLIDENQNDNTLQQQNQNNGSQSQNQIQVNQPKKQKIKLKKSQNKINQICLNQENNQFEQQFQMKKQDQEGLAMILEIIREIKHEKKQNQTKFQLDRQPQQTPRPQQPNSQQLLKQSHQQSYPQNQSFFKQFQPQQKVQSKLYYKNPNGEFFKLQLNRNEFKCPVLKSQIKKILIINRQVQMVASKKYVALSIYFKNNAQKMKVKLQEPIVDILLIDSEKIIIHLKDKLQFYDLSIQSNDFIKLKQEQKIDLIQNKFAYEEGIIYKYDDQTQILIKLKLENIQVLKRKKIELKDNIKVVVIKIQGEFLYVGFSNGMIIRFVLKTFDLDSNYNEQLPNQDSIEFRLFYFEEYYCIGVKENKVYLKFYNNQMNQNLQFNTIDTIKSCSYLIDYQKKRIEIQCLQESGRVFTFKKNENILYKNDQIKYKEVSSIQACPKLNTFYYGYTDGKLKCVKQRY